MTPLDQLRADLARAHAKLGRIQNHARTQLHILDMINDVLLLLRRYASALAKADADRCAPPGVPRLDPPAAQTLADVDVAGSRVPLADPEQPP